MNDCDGIFAPLAVIGAFALMAVIFCFGGFARSADWAADVKNGRPIVIEHKVYSCKELKP